MSEAVKKYVSEPREEQPLFAYETIIDGDITQRNFYFPVRRLIITFASVAAIFQDYPEKVIRLLELFL